MRLRDVEWEGLRVRRLSIVAGEVAITPPPDVALTASGVRLDGFCSLRELVAWVDRRVPRCRLGVAGDDLIEAVSRSGGRGFLVEAVVCDGELEVELRAVRWRGLQVRLPRWPRLTHSVPLSGLPDGISVSAARRRGATAGLVSRRGPGRVGRA